MQHITFIRRKIDVFAEVNENRFHMEIDAMKFANKTQFPFVHEIQLCKMLFYFGLLIFGILRTREMVYLFSKLNAFAVM